MKTKTSQLLSSWKRDQRSKQKRKKNFFPTVPRQGTGPHCQEYWFSTRTIPSFIKHISYTRQKPFPLTKRVQEELQWETKCTPRAWCSLLYSIYEPLTNVTLDTPESFLFLLCIYSTVKAPQCAHWGNPHTGLRVWLVWLRTPHAYLRGSFRHPPSSQSHQTSSWGLSMCPLQSSPAARWVKL